MTSAWVILEPPAKLNLFLEVLAKRPDGYHDLDMVMHAVDLCDTLQIRRAEDLAVACEGRGVGGGEANLAWKAVRALERVVGRPLPVEIRISKSIPPGGGFGGGSSDAAHALLGLRTVYPADVPEEALPVAAAAVGSDVAFFLSGGTARCTGRGEKVEPIEDVRAMTFLVFVPPFEVPTPVVYKGLVVPEVPRPSGMLVQALGSGSFLSVRRNLFNRLEERARTLFPALDRLMAAVAKATGIAPLLTGSGSGFFIVCESVEEAESLRRALPAGLEVETRVARSLAP